MGFMVKVFKTYGFGRTVCRLVVGRSVCFCLFHMQIKLPNYFNEFIFLTTVLQDIIEIKEKK